MSRKTFIKLLVCLLCLLPILTQAQSLTSYEYWFDDNFGERQSGNLSGTNTVARLSVGTDELDNGVHKFCFRARQSDGKYSAVTSSLFLKRSAAQSSQMEYWFDDNFDQRDVISLSNTEEEQNLELDLRNGTKYPMGFHKLNMRITLEGGCESAVYSTGVLKLSAGKATQMEYWVDDDYENVRTIEGHLASDGKDYIFVTDLDLGNIAPGHHRLYCRPVSNSKITTGAVTSMPIIVKSRYNIDEAEAAALTVTEHSYWFDNEEPGVMSVSNPRNIITQPYTLDTRRLSEGQHTLHLQYGNSAGVWNGPVDITFNKTHVNDPLIVANATVENGTVTLDYTSIPFGQRYIVVRQYPSGTKRKVDDLKNTEYPAALKATDTPAPGTYTYYIEGIYTDANGVTQKVRSGDMTVIVEKKASNVGKSSIYGIVTIDGERFPYQYKFYTITVNGQPIKKSPYHYSRLGTSEFEIESVPYGAELTIGIEYENYAFNNVTLIVDKDTSHKTYRFNSNSGDILEEQLDNDAFDLVMWNGIALTPDAWEIGVHNKYRYTPWSGNIIIKVISKEQLDLYDRDAAGEIPWWYYKLHPDAILNDGPNYTTVANTHVRLDGNEFKKMPLDIIDMPNGDKSKPYYVFIFTKKDDTDELKMMEGGQRYALNFNPITYMPGGDIDEFIINEYKQILRHLKKMKDWGDPFAFEINALSSGGKLDRIIDNLGNGTMDIEGIKKDIIVNGSQGAGLLLSCFIDDINDNIVEDVRRNGKEILSRFKLAEGIEEVCNTLESFYRLRDVDDNHKFLETFKLVMQVSEKLKKNYGIKYAAFDVYKSYFELADAMVDAIDRFESSVQGADVFEKLLQGKGIFKIKVRRYTSNGSVQYFSPAEVHKQIRNITFTLETETSFESKSTSYKVNTEDGYYDNELIITNVNFSPKPNTLYTTPQVYMTIYWTNNRVTCIPMLDKRFVKLKDFNTNSPTMTVELQSESNMINERMANKLTIINQK